VLTKRTKRLVVRPLEIGDFAAWQRAHETRRPPQHQYDMPVRRPEELTLAVFRKAVRTWDRLARADQMYSFGLFTRAGGELVGTINLLVVVRLTSQLAWIGYSVFNQHWRKGFGREGLAAVLSIAFRQLSLHRVEAGIQPKNRASIALVRSLGMRREGAPRRAVWIGRGWRDLVVYAASAEDFGVRVVPSVRTSTLDMLAPGNATRRSAAAPRSTRRAPPARRPASRAGSR
jgi:ribosomal-protein-alanine N-acetyltransferase